MNIRNTEVGSLVAFSVMKEYMKYAASKRTLKKDRAKKEELREIMPRIFELIGESMIDSKGGVFIRNFGYFFIFKSKRQDPIPIIRTGKPVEYAYQYHTDLYRYHPTFLGDNGVSDLKYWTMDYNFTSKVRKQVNKRLREGFKYRSYLYTMRKLLKYPDEKEITV